MQDLVTALEAAIAAATDTSDRAAARQALAAAEELARRLARAGGDVRPYGPAVVALRTRLGVPSGPVASASAIVDEAWAAIEP